VAAARELRRRGFLDAWPEIEDVPMGNAPVFRDRFNPAEIDC
jgi:hypothetical protein